MKGSTGNAWDFELEVQPPHRSKVGTLTIVLAVSLVVASSLAAFYYVEYAQSTQQVSSLNSGVASLRQERSTLLQLLLSSSTGPGAGGMSPPNATSINTSAIYDYANASVVTVEGLQPSQSIFGTSYQQVLGSGIVVNYRGSYYVVSNYHVVQHDINVSITFHDGNAFAAKVVGSDPYSDLAVLQAQGAPTSELFPLTFAASSALRVGQQVVAIGNPYGLSGSLTEGLVSQLGRTIQDATSGNFSVADVIQISTPINPGNSGGPLLNARGQVVGITTAIVSGSQGIGFAIPSDTIVRELPYLVSTGSYTLHPYLGIQAADMSYDLAQAAHVNVTYGVLVESVVKGGPAAQAGLEAGTAQKTVDGSTYTIGGDIIVSVNGTRITNNDALSTWLQERAVAGQIVSLGIIRGGTQMTLSVTLGTRPPV